MEARRAPDVVSAPVPVLGGSPLGDEQTSTDSEAAMCSSRVRMGIRDYELQPPIGSG